MGLSAPAKLFFIAAAMFVVVAAIGFIEGGIELKSIVGLVMAGALVTLGLKARRSSAA